MLDRKMEYQFGFFLQPLNMGTSARVPRETIAGLRKHFEASSASLRIRFGDAVVEDGLIAVGGQALQVPTVTWTSGVWRMVWSPLRMDVYADAHTYADVAEKPLALDAALARVLPGLVGAADELQAAGFVVHRLLLAVTGESMLAAGDRTVRAAVARRFLSEDVREATESGEALDVGARIDWGTQVDLGDGLVPVHRVENVGTELTYNGTDPSVVLRAMWDVNTSPGRGTSALPTSSFAPFFTMAERWISERRARVEQ